MAKFAIYANGEFMGFFNGEDAKSAIDAMHIDAGYKGTEGVSEMLEKSVEKLIDECYVVNIDDLMNAKPDFDIIDSTVDGHRTIVSGKVMIGNLRGLWSASIHNRGYEAAYLAGEEQFTVEYDGPRFGATDNDVEIDEIGDELIERHSETIELLVFRYMQTLKAAA